MPMGGRRWLTHVLASLLLFAGFFLLFDRLAFLAIRAEAAHFYSSLRREHRPLSNPVEAGGWEILVLGTSRSRQGFAEDILSTVLQQKVFMEARAGKFPQYNFLFFRHNKRFFNRLRAVIYGIDYFMFDHPSSRVELARLGRVSGGGGMDPQGAVNAAAPLLSRVSWLYRLKPDIDALINDWLNRGGLPGGEKVARGAEPEGAMNVNKPDAWPTKTYVRFPGLEGRFFQKLLTEFAQARVPVFLVLLPDFIGTNETNVEQEAFKDDIRRLAAGFHGGYFIDFNTPQKFDLRNPRLFKDCGWGRANCHLSREGSLLFSQRLALKLREILGD